MERITLERVYSAAIDSGNLLAAVADKRMFRTDVATLYVDCMIADRVEKERGRPGVDWRELNRAILARWSPAGLDWIKKRAWKLAERMR